MGPLVTRAHRDRVAGFIDSGEAAGAKLVVDGRDVTVDGDEDGFWLGPTLFDHVHAGHGRLHARRSSGRSSRSSGSRRTTRPSR